MLAPTFLLTNDDGVFAEGLSTLFAELNQKSEELFLHVVAPDRDCSGSSSSLTLSRPLQPRTHNNGFLSIDGTPSDCGHLGSHGALGFKPDGIISGINRGANLGDDVIYSGTVAAAIEGRYLSYMPVAVSLCGEQHFVTAAKFVKSLLRQLHLDKTGLPQRTILNINVPDLPADKILGVEITRLGKREKAGTPKSLTSPRGDLGYWLGDVGAPIDFSLGTDFNAIERHKISITPLHLDMTNYDAFDALANLALDDQLTGK